MTCVTLSDVCDSISSIVGGNLLRRTWFAEYSVPLNPGDFPSSRFAIPSRELSRTARDEARRAFATRDRSMVLPCCRESYTPVNPDHQGRKLLCARVIGYLCGLNLFLLGLDTASQLL